MTRRYRGDGTAVPGGMRLARRSILPLLVVGAAVLGACSSDDDGGGVTDAPTTTLHAGSPSTLPAADPEIIVSADGFGGWTEESSDGCTQIVGRIVDPGGDWVVDLQLTGTSCPVEEPLNGRHGTYRTAADLPATTTTPVETAIGEGVAFIQTYTECTNSCSDFEEPIALITLDTPPDAEHPTLTLIGIKGEASAEDLAEIAAGLQPG